MQESPFYEIIIQKGFQKGFQQGFQIGFQQGAREMGIKNILSVLTKRFPQQDVHQVAEALDAITNLDRLLQLHTIALDTPSVKAFLEVLNA